MSFQFLSVYASCSNYRKYASKFQLFELPDIHIDFRKNKIKNHLKERDGGHY